MKTISALATLALSTLLTPAALANATKATTCVGTEPFWGLTIDAKNVAFRSSEGFTRTIDNKGPQAALGRTAEYISLYQGKVKEEAGRFLNVIVRNEACSDGMSDETYPLSVLVLSGTELYTGCCRDGR